MMAAAPVRVLFICHSASRNGATILLLDLLRWLKERVDWDLHVLMQGTGPLLPEFREVARTTVWRDPGPPLDVLFRRSKSGLQRFLEEALRRIQLPSGRFELIYANTFAATPSLVGLAGRAKSMLWHIHELGYALRVGSAGDAIDERFRLPTLVVAASDAVKKTLCGEFHVPSDRVQVVHSFTPVRAGTAKERQVRRTHVRAGLSWSPDAFVIGGCGTLGWRKGTDLFVQIAHLLAARRGQRDVRFLWLGGSPGSREWLEMEHDVRFLGLSARMRIVPSTADVSDYYCAMDTFALTSREDPFPLVVLEAAEHGVPTVCFEGTGGAVEFIGDDAGAAVPYLDLEAFAAQLERLRDAESLCVRMGLAGQRKVRELYRIESQGPKLLDAMQACMANGGKRVHDRRPLQ